MTVGAGDIRAGGAYVEFGANTAGLRAGLKAATQSLGGFRNAARPATLAIAALSAAAYAAGLRALKSFSDYGNKIAKTAKRVGTSAQFIGEMGYAAELSGASASDMLRGMAKAMEQAAMGSMEVVGVFDSLGFSQEQLLAMDPEARFLALGAAVARIQDPSQKAAAAMKLFGRSGMMLIPMFDEGGAAIAAMRKEFRDLYGEKNWETAEQLNDQFGRVKTAFAGIRDSIASALTPAFMALSGRIMGVVIHLRNLIDQNPALVGAISKAAIALAGIAGAAWLVQSRVAAMAVTMIASVLPVAIPLGIISVAVLSILESFDIVSVGVNERLAFLWDGFTAFGRSLSDWATWVGGQIDIAFSSAWAGLLEGLDWVVKKIGAGFRAIADLAVWVMEDMQIIGKDKADSMRAKNAAAIEKGTGVVTSAAASARARANASADKMGEFNARQAARNEGKVALEDMAANTWGWMKGLVTANFTSAALPKMPGAEIEDVGGGGAERKLGAVGFFGGTRLGEMLGGNTVQEKHFSEAKRQTKILEEIAKQRGGAAFA